MLGLPVGIARFALARRYLPRVDVTSLLSLYVLLLLGIPSQLIFGPLGAAGTPANLLGMLCLLWWILVVMLPFGGVATGPQPIRIAMVFLATMVLGSYAAGALRADIVPEELRAADRGLLLLVTWAGVALITADGVRSWHRLDVLIGRLVAMGVFLAVLGILQFSIGLNIAGYIHIPGLRVNGTLDLISARSIFRRITGTASHPIEFGVVLAMLLPLAISRAFAAPAKLKVRRWLAAASIGVALPMSVSRSAILAIAVVAVFIIPSWDRRRRLATFKVMPLFLVGMRVAIPGLLGTITSLFTGISNDPSTKGRTEDYAAAAKYIAVHPLFGRGFRTFIPSLYRFLDNQYLMTIVDAGLIGLVLLVLVFLVGIFTARGARRRNEDPIYKDLAQAIAAGIGAAMVSFATFDALSFPMCGGLLFLLLGLAGAMWRLSGQPDDRIEKNDHKFHASAAPAPAPAPAALPAAQPLADQMIGAAH